MDRRLATRTLGLLMLILLVSNLAGCAGPTPQATTAPQAQVSPGLATQAGEQPTAPKPSTSPKVLKLRITNDVSNLDPAYHPATADGMVLLSVMQGLVQYKPGTLQVENVLADSMTPSADGLRIDFKLREGVQFQGGYGEVTADDVKFTYERYIKLDVPEKVNWAQLDHVEVTGKYTGTIIMKTSFAPLWTNTLPFVAGEIMSKKYVDDKGPDAYVNHPIGTGPYEFVEWVPKQHVTVKRFDGFQGAKPEWDEIQFIPVVEDSAAQIALETGELDFASIPESMVAGFQGNSGFDVIKIVTPTYDGLLMNVQHPNLKDINVRQAIRYAIDVPSILKAAYEGLATQACAIVPEGQLGYWAEAPCYTRDVAKAKEYLAKAATKPTGLTVTVMNSDKEKAVGEIIQANLADIGLKAEVIVQDEATYWDGGMGETGLKTRQLTLIMWSTIGPDPSYNTSFFTCDQVLQWNWMYWCNQEYDKLHYGALQELDPAKRAAMYIQLQRIWDEAVNVVWIAHPASFFATKHGIQPSLTSTAIPVPWAFTSD